VRFGKQEVVTDAGTFAYNAPAPWNNALVSARVHNGPVLDDAEPAQRGPRFLWYSWPISHMVSTRYSEGVATLVAEVPGLVRREVNVTADRVEVIDRALSPASSVIEVFWLLHPDVSAHYNVQAQSAQCVVASEDDVRGWFSPSYGKRVPSTGVTIRCNVSRNGPLVLSTFLHPERLAS
jgi:hypothetical protein